MDQKCKEGIEYCEPFWKLIVMLRKQRDLEIDFELGLLIAERNEFYRRVRDNDKPGRRHMLPFVWSNTFGAEGSRHSMQVPIKFGSPRFNAKMDEYDNCIRAINAKRIDRV